MTAVWLPILVASVAGSLHCAAMCGSFSAAVCVGGADGRPSGLAQAAYHLGRLVTYLALALMAGLLGNALDLAGNAAGVGRVSAFVAGGLLVVWGLTTLFATRGLSKLRRRAPRRLGSALGPALARLRALPPLPRAFALGLSTTLVPCGWLYAFVATAAGSGGVVPALSIMFAFWLGTVPALVAAGFGLRRLLSRFGAHARVATASLIVISGVVVLAARVLATPGVGAAEGAANAPEMPANCPLHARSSD